MKNTLFACISMFGVGSVLVLPSASTLAGEKTKLHGLPLIFSEDFEDGADRWQPTDPKAWKISKGRGGKVYNQFVRRSKYKPPHRSPYNVSLLKDVMVSDFVLTAKVRSTIPDYGHRDVCLFFGYQDPAHFYYVHLGKRADDHANQIFIVNGKARVKISAKTTKGTNWDDAWHDVKIVRSVKNGRIEIYFDDMKTPVMVARRPTPTEKVGKKDLPAVDVFTWGRIGLGSFDDTGEWDDVKLYGLKVKPPKP